MANRSVAIIGEGETEWFYFDALRVARHYTFRVAPDFPQHSDIQHIAYLAERKVTEEYDYVVCLIDMDRLKTHPKEMETYQRIRRNSNQNIMWIETNPCTEFWFLLHFLPQLSVKHYDSYEQLLPELQRYMPGYEKTKRYLHKELYKFLSEHGNMDMAIRYSKKLCELSMASPEDNIAYTEIHKVFELLQSIEEENNIIDGSKIENEKRISVKHQEILNFVASNDDSDSKSIAKAIGLRVPRTRDYLKDLIKMGEIEVSGGVRYKTYRIKNK